MKRQLAVLRRGLSSTTARLTGSYLIIIMLMSIGFSIIFFHTSSHELGRQIPPPNYSQQYQPNTYDDDNNPFNRDHRYDAFFASRIAEARRSLMQNLIIVNASAFVIGAVVSYGLARRTLEPIEANMEAQTQFVSNAAHELRTPLTSLRTANEVALRRSKLTGAETRSILSQNVEDATRLQELTDGLLELARPDTKPLQLSSVPLQLVAADAMNRVITPAQAKQIAIEDTVGLEKVLASQTALTQVLVILLDNAIKYSPAGSTVTLSSASKGSQVFLKVRDQGIGIAAQDLPHIFQRFYRADAVRTGNADHQGYGIGLAIAEKVVDMQGGKITVQSEEGKGTEFTVRLQAAA